MHMRAYPEGSQGDRPVQERVSVQGGCPQGGEEVMGFRAKHRRANWIPERLAKAQARQAKDDKRKDECAIERARVATEAEMERARA